MDEENFLLYRLHARFDTIKTCLWSTN